MSSMAKVMQKIREGSGAPSPDASAPPENADAQPQDVAGEETQSEELVLKEDVEAGDAAAAEAPSSPTDEQAEVIAQPKADEAPVEGVEDSAADDDDDTEPTEEAADEETPTDAATPDDSLEDEAPADEFAAADDAPPVEPAAIESSADEAPAEEAPPEPAAAEVSLDDAITPIEPTAEDEESGFIPDAATHATSFVEGEMSTPAAVPAEPVDDAAMSDAAEPAFEDETAEASPVSHEVVTWDNSGVDPVVVAFHDRYSAVCEQYRSVRARLMTMNTTRTNQVVTVTSSIPEEGKSVTTVNLGLIMAEGGEHQVLIADADFRRTSIARMLGIPPNPGLSDVLREKIPLEEAVQSTPFPNLKILPAGDLHDKDYGDLIGRPTAAGVLNQCRAMFDYTFLDTPPITTVSDVCLLAPHCDGALMVIEMRRTPEPTVQQAVRTLQANNVKILGCLLSRFRDRGSGYYERYYSAYYR